MTSDSALPGVTLVGGGPGAWDLITVRGMNALVDADVILTDHLGPTDQLDRLIDVPGKEIIDVSKLPYKRQVSQGKTNELIVSHARAGRKVVRLKGGDPYVFGRGFEELQVCREHDIPCEVVPGVTSAVSVPGAAGVPITQRGVVHSFTVVSGHLPPGHPSSLVDWSALARTGGTISVIMGVRHVAAIADALMAADLAPETPAAIIQEGTTDGQRSFRCTLGTLAETMTDHAVEAPAVYVIGEVAGL
ncbi:uroporphyrinogen-III C-methyltransferase [Corynebacterium suedekumii]|uniref:uroporphyrinogen-III C-methyltransferase n=1 Tax=Corynebacterium suedekumii TaxID=3049801 RepID=A0ABY8VR09_9CORY|nr:uroporphyrinogen-III C-methyltransferase [Corynebacterium suedekumii]WIM69980.1 uroporphyrinogen-III C-methyltransferase [Corynebacterium suedekumii]